MVLTTEPAGGIVFVRRNTGVSLSTLSEKVNSTNLVRITSRFSRPQGGLAVAVIRAHPGQNFPSLTSRGRPRQQKPTALIERRKCTKGDWPPLGVVR